MWGLQWGYVSTLLSLGYICLCPGTATFLHSVGMTFTGLCPFFQSSTPGRNSSVRGTLRCCRGRLATSCFSNSAHLLRVSGDISRYRSLIRPLPRLGGHAVHRTSSPEDAVQGPSACTRQFLAMPLVATWVIGGRPAQLQPDLALSLSPPWLASLSTQVFWSSSSIAPQVPSTPASSTFGPTPRTDTPATIAAPPDVQALMDEWQEAFLARMKDMLGATLPQPKVGPSVPRNTGSNALRQLGPSDDWETSWAQRKAGSKRADRRSLTRSSSGGPQGQVEINGLSRNNAETPVPHCPFHTGGHLRLNGREQTVPAPFIVLALPMTACEALTFMVGETPLAHPTAVIAVVLLPPPNGTVSGTVPLSLFSTPCLAWLGDLLWTTLCPQVAVHPLTRIGDHHGAITCPLGPEGCPPIASTATRHLGHHHLEPTGAGFHVLGAHVLGPLTVIAGDVIIKQTNVFFVCVTSLLSLMPEMRTRTPHRTPRGGFSPHVRGCQEVVWWSASSSWTVSLRRSLPGT